ncbi:MAG: MBL fold metallo-hydrolase [Abditibacteriales bacterium]|nr:MBL fold metallo-hydrolase [Abditibacteriales bacterium]MDW8368131.1 MBL fold metallo-hydrolase [Abditibacteriales bacterium]
MQREKVRILLAVVLGVLLAVAAGIPQSRENLTVEKTKDGNLTIQALGHGSLRFEFKGKQYYVDPWSRANLQGQPKADVIFITHEHGDHLDKSAIDLIKKDTVLIYTNERCAKQLGTGTVLHHGEKKKVADIIAEAVPAYNITPSRQNFHPKDRKDNGYVLTFSDKRVYVAGDTEGTPEMKALKDIDIAFLPIDGRFTMSPADAAEAARAFKPKVLYPYHQLQSDPNEVKKLLTNEKGIEVRVWKLP